jgi:outer membrane protein assembly factor BamD
MNCWPIRALFICLAVFLFPFRSPAPLVYRPGEGWSYESPSGKADQWRRLRAKDQLDVAQAAFDQKDYKVAMKAAQRVVTVWPLSDYAPQALYLAGRCYEERRQDEKAFKAYVQVLDKYPKIPNATEIQGRQLAIADRFLGGERVKLFGYIPLFPSREKAAQMYGDIVKFGPYGPCGPAAQMNIGAAWEIKKDYQQAVQAYEVAADRYSAQPEIAATALFKAATAWSKQARKADYDQGAASQAISSFSDFIALYPRDPRVPEAQQVINSLKMVQARGDFSIAQYYEKNKRWAAAQIYYNQVRANVRGEPLADEAAKRIEALSLRLTGK